jgi:hypothetical protein
MAEVLIKFVRVTDPDVAIANAADYTRRVDSTLVPQVGDWVQFSNGRHTIESRIWSYTDDVATCSLGIDFVGQRL